MLSSPKTIWNLAWCKRGCFKPQPSHRYLERKHACLAFRVQGASLTKVDGKVDEW